MGRVIVHITSITTATNYCSVEYNRPGAQRSTPTCLASLSLSLAFVQPAGYRHQDKATNN